MSNREDERRNHQGGRPPRNHQGHPPKNHQTNHNNNTNAHPPRDHKPRKKASFGAYVIVLIILAVILYLTYF